MLETSCDSNEFAAGFRCRQPWGVEVVSSGKEDEQDDDSEEEHDELEGSHREILPLPSALAIRLLRAFPDAVI